jgi:hypothetical protein
MIELTVNGRTGNYLFQTVFSRLLAEQLQYKLVVLEGQKSNYNLGPDGRLLIPQLDCHSNTGHLYKICNDNVIEVNDDWFRDHHQLGIQGMSEMLKGHKVVVKGFFENGEFYQPYRDNIKSWFELPNNVIDSSVLHIRGLDTRNYGRSDDMLDYHRQVLSHFENVRIITDDPHWEYVTNFGVKVQRNTVYQDFIDMYQSKHLAIGFSTLAWWAAFLGNHEEIIQPLRGSGWRSIQECFALQLHVQSWKHFYTSTTQRDLIRYPTSN